VIAVLIAQHDHLAGSIQMSGSGKRIKDTWNESVESERN
jgi:hypothetical protein